jgi:glyoxylate reductase
MRVVATTNLPIDLPSIVGAALPGARVDVPEQWIGVERCDLHDADALVCLLLDRIDADVLARAPKLRVVANCAVGYDNVDLAACACARVVVANTPDVLTEATAELTIALVFAAARRLGEGERLARGGAWIGWRLDQLLGQPIAGRTLGIVGLGRIGRAVARRGEALGMRVVHSDLHGGLPLDELLSRADVVSLHCPLTPATHHLIDAARLARMKPTAILVNTARGAIVDAVALANALEQNALFAAALDVFEGEPEIPACLLAAPRLVLAPHLGSATTEARTAMATLCADAVIAVLSGRTPANEVRAHA